MKTYLLPLAILFPFGTTLSAQEQSSATDTKDLSYTLVLRTNTAHDLMAIPNIGAELYLPHEWSVGVSYDYAWWTKHSKRVSWRFICLEGDTRHWFGRELNRDPYTGHHLGLYGQCYVYDFALGHHGYLGGRSHGRSFQSANYSFGVEYGYTYALTSRLRLDLDAGVGYAGGKYLEYRTVSWHDRYRRTIRRHWLGPTKADVALLWLVDVGKIFSRQKGGGP